MEKEGGKNLTKEDIGDPKDFRHVVHFGWDPQDGFNYNNMDKGEKRTKQPRQKPRQRPRGKPRTGASSPSGVPPSTRGAPPPPPSSRGSAPPPPTRTGAPPPPPSTRAGPLPLLPVGAPSAPSPRVVPEATLPPQPGMARDRSGPPPPPPVSGGVPPPSRGTPKPPSPSRGSVLSPSRIGAHQSPSRRAGPSPLPPVDTPSAPSPPSVPGATPPPPPVMAGDRPGPPPPPPVSGGRGDVLQHIQQGRSVRRQVSEEDKRNSGNNVAVDANLYMCSSMTDVNQNQKKENKTPFPSPFLAAGTSVEEISATSSFKRSESFPSSLKRTLSSFSLSRTATTLPQSHQTKMKGGLSKADLGYPCDFRHVAHIGWDPDGSFNVNNGNIDEKWKKKLFSMISPNKNQMQGEIDDHEAAKNATEQRKERNVPLEIIFRGPEAEKAYREALKNGEVEVYRGRIMLIGQDRAGKTSLKKSLLGLSFDPNEQSTDGVVVDPSNFSVDVDDAVDWQISKTGDVKKNNFEDGVASIMVEMLSQSHEVREPESTQSQPRHQQVNQEIKKDKEEEKETANVEKELIAETSTTTDTFALQESNAIDQRICEDVIDKVQNDVSASNHHVVDSGHDILEKSKEKSKGDMDTGNVTKKVVPETVMENLIQRLSAKNLGSSAGEETTVSIWDFAGQQLYYASHPVFFTHRAVYVLVYTLEKDLVAEAEPCVRQGVHEIRLDNHDQQTNLEALLSWLVSIHSARPEASDGGKIHNKLPYLRPPVIIVGTHADCPLVKESKKVEEKIQKSLTRKSYEQHVVRPFITVDNTKSSNDDGVKKLKEKVKELFSTEPYMGEKVPVRWFKFEQVIKSLVEDEGKNHMSLKDLERLILEVCNIEDKKEISALLTFYHDLGVIVKHGNTVVLKAEWLIDLFRKLITIRPFNDQNPVNSGSWKTLEETGILDMELVEHVFKEKIDGGETKDDILAMMENYGLIARFGGNEDQKNFHYFVPAQLQSSPEAFFDIGPSTSDPCTLYLYFLDGFIPHGLYNLLVSRLITWCSKKGYPHEPNLYQSVSRFFIGRTYQYELFLMRRKRFVKVVLRSLQTERSWVFQPVTFQIREFFESSLKEITEECLWYQSLNCKICVRCPSRHVVKCEAHQLESCIDDGCLHMLPIEEDRELVCRKSIGEESKPEIPGLEEWYREHTIIPVHEEDECIGSLSVNTTFDLSNDQKRWLVIGICLNKILLPTLRSFIEPKMLGLYSHLQTTNNIDTQIPPGHLTRDGKCKSLNYASINNNEANHRKRAHLYDYSVNSAVDLAKLYLQPFMAKFSDFDDTCDVSAALSILSSASAFSSDVQDLSSQVRKDVRNEWGHCNFSVWDEAMFAACLKLIDSLVKALCLTPEEEKRITDELQEWEAKGVQLCMGKITDADLVKFIEFSDAVLDRLTREMRHLENRQEDEAHRVNNALHSMRNDFENYKDNINKKIESLEKRIEKRLESHDRKLKAMELAMTSKR